MGQHHIWRSLGQDQGHSSKNVQNSVFPQCRTLTSSNSGSVEHRAVKFVFSMGFSDMADRMLWPPSLSRDLKYMHSRVVCLRLEALLFVYLYACFFLSLFVSLRCFVLPYILAYKPTIFGWILRTKLWGSAYTRVMPHSHTLAASVSAAWTISRPLGLRAGVNIGLRLIKLCL